MEKRYPTVLTIAGSDSGGGAGIQADLKTISALGCYGTSVITAITAQNTQGVRGIHSIPPGMVKMQAEAVFEDIEIDAVKIGMLHSVEIVKIVKSLIIKYKPVFVVLDPVMVAASGDKLIEDNTTDVIIDELFPVVDLITPNLYEAEIVSGEKITSLEDMQSIAPALLSKCKFAILLKGGHLEGETIYNLYLDKETNKQEVLQSSKINTNNIHGSGCTLSSAIASYLAKGNTMFNSVKLAEEYINNAIHHGKDIKTGKGSGPLNHFFDPQKLKAK